MKLLIVLSYVFLFCTSVSSQQPVWFIKLKQLQPAKAERSDVERVFNSPRILQERDLALLNANGWGEIVLYETSFGELEATYSTGQCSETLSSEGYDIAKGHLVQLIFYPDDFVSPSAFGIDLDTLSRERVEDVVDSFVYHDREKGISIGV